MIPELIKQKIENKYPFTSDSKQALAAEYGYSLAESEIEKWRNGYNTIFDQSKNKIEEQDFEIERLSKEVSDLKGVNNPFPLGSVLKRLSEATKILLHKKDYDGPDYEELNVCAKRAEEIIKQNNL